MAQTLSFYRVDTLPTTLVVGGIYFDKSTGALRIAKTTTTTEDYGGIINAVTSGNKLTLTKADGSTVVFDLTATITSITNRLTALETSIAGKINSVTAGNNAITIDGSASDPTVALKLSTTAGNAATINSTGLMVAMQTIADATTTVKGIATLGATGGAARYGQKADVGLGNVDNTSDANKPVSTATQTALNLKEDKSNKGIANGYASLDSNGKVPLTQINDVLLGQMLYAGTFVPSTAVATLSDNAKAILGTTATTITLTNDTTPITGYKANEGNYYIANASGTFATIVFEIGDWLISTGSGWAKIANTDAVTSVAGRTGAVVLTKSDVGLSNVDNTSDVNKPISTATQTALNSKASITHVGSNGVIEHALGDGVNAGFSTNDYTASEKTKLAGIATGAQVNIIESFIINGKTAAVSSKNASVIIGASDVITTGYTKPATATAITTSDTVNTALGKLERKIDNAVAGGVTSITAGNGISITGTTNVPIISAIASSAVDNAVTVTSAGIYAPSLTWGSF